MSDVPQNTIQKWQKIADHLLRLSAIGRLKWDDTAEHGKFVTSIGDNTVVLDEFDGVDKSGNHVPLIRISIRDFFDEEIDIFTDDDLGGDYYVRFKELLRVIERNSTGAERVLDELIEELDRMDLDTAPF
ncbi:hypothetical protein [Paracoccus fistulariae]|uniref:Uncharacterized protein n=1 Tax=Paracoccus fistulariae TaxID=658446 RepID=A0ABY7SMQ2_9RHOB|nr:hypothetical protein [Paracoccus fistulariae]MDB6180194.1 hypothetical protein [Paracoccus fistulariae]WCR08280.1 hypothetical protein JHX87_05545 [Paracoccus fistulariae]